MYQIGFFKRIWIWLFGGDLPAKRAVCGLHNGYYPCKSFTDPRCSGNHCGDHCERFCKGICLTLYEKERVIQLGNIEAEILGKHILSGYESQ